MVLQPNKQLVAPASYFPLHRGRYEVSPGLYPLGNDFGNGIQDHLTFQLDNQFAVYWQQKQACRDENLGKYFVHQDLQASNLQQVNDFIVATLVKEYPEFFVTEKTDSNTLLQCHLTQSRMCRPHNTQLDQQLAFLDFLAMQIQEDLALIQLAPNGNDQLCLLHLCFPNYWAAADKIGKDFIATHQPVAEFDRLAKRSSEIVNAMIHKGPFVRFAWGLTTDTRLNHHPVPAPGYPADDWQGRQFNPDKPQLFLRVERQTTHGLPAIQSALFTIRTYFTDVNDIKADNQQRLALLSALESMSTDSLAYKGLSTVKRAIIDWLME